MKNEDMLYDSVCRIEKKLDQHISDTSRYVTRAELLGWLSFLGIVFGGTLALA